MTSPAPPPGGLPPSPYRYGVVAQPAPAPDYAPAPVYAGIAPYAGPGQPYAPPQGSGGGPPGQGWHTMPAYPPLSRAQVQGAVPRKLGHRLLGLVLLGALVLLGLVGVAAAAALKPAAATLTCPPTCTVGPRNAPALPAARSFTSDRFGWSLEYYENGLLPVRLAKQTSSAVSFDSDAGPVVFDGVASSDSPQQLVESRVQNLFPDAQLVYVIPNAQVGYVPGYGAVYDAVDHTSGGQSVQVRVIVEAAVQDGVAVRVTAEGQFVAGGKGAGHPNPAGTFVVYAFGEIANSVTWKGHPSL